jgi:DNA-binding CsgD family transcriptional regulator
LASQPTFKGGLTNLIPPEKRSIWQQFYTKATEPAIFKFWCDQLAESLVDAAVKSFDRILKVAVAQQSMLPIEPVEWTKTIVLDLLYSLEFTLPGKIKAMCDEQKNRADFANEYFYAYCAWVYWRAPRFVHMQPSGNTPYDPDTAWDREDEDTTERLLHGLTETILDPARFKLDDLAGEAYVSLASTPPPQVYPQDRPARHYQTTHPDKGAFPNIELRESKELPEKQTDLSNYFDQAQLTDRQRECVSLKLEYGMTVTDIADRLGITRKTVDEHVEAAERKIEIARARERASKQKSRLNSEK